MPTDYVFTKDGKWMPVSTTPEGQRVPIGEPKPAAARPQAPAAAAPSGPPKKPSIYDKYDTAPQDPAFFDPGDQGMRKKNLGTALNIASFLTPGLEGVGPLAKIAKVGGPYAKNTLAGLLGGIPSGMADLVEGHGWKQAATNVGLQTALGGPVGVVADHALQGMRNLGLKLSGVSAPIRDELNAAYDRVNQWLATQTDHPDLPKVLHPGAERKAARTSAAVARRMIDDEMAASSVPGTKTKLIDVILQDNPAGPSLDKAHQLKVADPPGVARAVTKEELAYLDAQAKGYAGIFQDLPEKDTSPLYKTSVEEGRVKLRRDPEAALYRDIAHDNLHKAEDSVVRDARDTVKLTPSQMGDQGRQMVAEAREHFAQRPTNHDFRAGGDPTDEVMASRGRRGLALLNSRAGIMESMGLGGHAADARLSDLDLIRKINEQRGIRGGLFSDIGRRGTEAGFGYGLGGNLALVGGPASLAKVGGAAGAGGLLSAHGLSAIGKGIERTAKATPTALKIAKTGIDLQENSSKTKRRKPGE